MSFPFVFENSCRQAQIAGGWVYDQPAIKKFVSSMARPYFGQQTDVVPGSGRGKTVLLHKYLLRALSNWVTHNQGIGDCVSHAYGLGCDILAAHQIFGLKRAEKFIAEASTEVIYAGSRYEIGYKTHGNSRILQGDGSIGAYAAEYLKTYGVLPRGKHGKYDLTTYNASRAREWGHNGIPDELEPTAKLHPVRSYALVRSYEETRDAIANGYPVIFCSNFGFNPECRQHNPGGRDDMGFLRRCGEWWHAMCGIGVDDTKRPGVLIQNSWGPNWVGGPKRLEQPDGSFWVDAETIDGMCAMGDTYALSQFLGFPAQRLDYILF